MSGDQPPPLVSVVINCFNGERYLREAMDSIAAQTYSAWEIVFWDNGSTDASAEIARGYGSRVRYFRAAETTPLGAARNLALQQTSGTYVAFLDCDDVWMPDALATLVSAMEGAPWAACYGGIVRIDASGRELGTWLPPPREGDLLDALLTQFDINVPAVLVRRSALEATGLSFDPIIVASEEYCLFMQLAAKQPFKSMPVPIARYRIHDGALTNRSIAKWAEEREYTLQRIVDANPGIVSRHRAAFREAYARARYYRARFLLSTGKKLRAIRELSRIALVDFRYAGLFLLSMGPTRLWDELHRARTQRAQGIADAPNR
jgi:glycosyltransferase involved in cell wall biosynthesis